MIERKTGSYFKLAAIAIGTIVAFSTLFVFLLNPYQISLSTQKKPVILLGNYVNSHIIRVHVGKNKEWLKKRLKYRDYLHLVSTFYSMRQAEEVIKDTLDTHKDRVNHWVRDQTVKKNMRKSFRKTFKTPIGFGVKRDEEKTVDLMTVKVLIQKVNNHSFKIISAYPIPIKRS
ncbi:MAG: RNase A-like domain-containing protein [Rickettsiales bacterium]